MDWENSQPDNGRVTGQPFRPREQHAICTERYAITWLQLGKTKKSQCIKPETSSWARSVSLFLFQPSLDLQGHCCGTENGTFIHLSWDICESAFFPPLHPWPLFIWSALRKGPDRVFSPLAPNTELPSEHSVFADWLANRQPVLVGDYLCRLAKLSPGMVITLVLVVTSGVRDPIREHFMDIGSEDPSRFRENCALKSCSQSLPCQHSSDPKSRC